MRNWRKRIASAIKIIVNIRRIKKINGYEYLKKGRTIKSYFAQSISVRESLIRLHQMGKAVYGPWY